MGLFLLFDFVNGAQGSLVCMCLKQKCWVLADGHFNFLLVYGQTISWSGGCSNICLHHQSVGVTTSYILILCWLSDLVLTWRIYLIASSGLISYVFSAFRKTLGKKKLSTSTGKKAEVTILDLTHRISDLYSLMAFWVISTDFWVFAGSRPVWTAFLRAWSLKRHRHKFWVSHSSPCCR